MQHIGAQGTNRAKAARKTAAEDADANPVVVTFGGPKSPERFLKVVNFSQKSLSDDDDDVFPEFLVFDWIKHVKGLFLNNDLNKFLLW